MHAKRLFTTQYFCKKLEKIIEYLSLPGLCTYFDLPTYLGNKMCFANLYCLIFFVLIFLLFVELID
jgi:hypothetical protein